jgi:hypothetical protein
MSKRSTQGNLDKLGFGDEFLDKISITKPKGKKKANVCLYSN